MIVIERSGRTFYYIFLLMQISHRLKSEFFLEDIAYKRGFSTFVSLFDLWNFFAGA